jgi:outer membrane protein TolC
MSLRNILLVNMIMLASVPVFSQNADNPAQGNNLQTEKSPGSIQLNLQFVIKGVLDRGLDVKKAAIDYKNSASDLSKFLGQYDVFAFGSAAYSYKQTSKDNPSIVNPMNTGGLATTPYQMGVNDYQIGAQKKFSTGTTVQAGIDAQQLDAVVYPGFSKVTAYQTSASIGLSQELFKNAFGADDRMTEKALRNVSEIKKRSGKQAIADSLMNSFLIYWNFIIADENLKTAQVAHKNTLDIRDLIRRKSVLGLSEKADLLDWESRALQMQNSVEGAQLAFLNAKTAVLRALDLDRQTDIRIEQDLVSAPPEISYEVALKEAFKKRTDLANLRAADENAALSYEIAKGNLNPSIKAVAGFGSNDYNEKFGKSYDTFNKQWNVGVIVSSPIGNTYANADLDSTKNERAKRRIELSQLEDGIRDEIRIRLSACETSFKIYKQSAQSSEYSKGYYDQILQRFMQGRADTTMLKLAFDNYIMLRTNALKSLIDYNVAMLQFDIAKNTVFEKYAINTDKILEKNDKE